MKKLLLLFTCLSFILGTYAQVSKTVKMTAAGKLSSTLTSTEALTVTNLTVSGTIDARDFVFMRDQMPALSVLDLSAANIKMYFGTSGTYSGVLISYPSNELPEYAFYNLNTNTIKSSLTSITLPSSLTSIGYLALYYCVNLSGTFNIPAGVNYIGDYALYGCTGISAYNVTSGNTRYSSYDGMLMDNTQDSLFICPTAKTGTITLPSNLKWIGPSAFEGCSKLTGNLNLPSTVTFIGSYAFYGCSGLTGTITFPAGLVDLGYFSFFQCDSISAYQVNSNNPIYSSYDGMLYSKNIDTLFICPATKTGTVTFPASLKVFGSYSMYDCSHIQGNISISSSVTQIGDYAFFGCNSIGGFSVDANNPYFSSVSGVLFDKNIKQLIECPVSQSGSYVIPNTVTTIAPGAFCYCSNLTGTINLPASVTNIGDYAFYGCSNIDGFTVDANNPTFSARDGLLFSHDQDSLFICPLAKSGNYVVPSTVTYIGYSAFDGCNLLTEVELPSSVKIIDKYAFEYCTGLKKIYVAENVDTIGTAAFYNCSGLQQFSIKKPVPPVVDYYTFGNVDQKSCTLVVLSGYSSNYANALFWSDFGQILESPFADVNKISSEQKIAIDHNNITISGLPYGEIVEVYTIDGKNMFQAVTKSDILSLGLPFGGNYILRTGNEYHKVFVP